MNRAVNNVLFVLLATFLIFVLIMVIFLVLFIPFMIFMKPQDPIIGLLGMVIIFSITVGGAFFIYNKIMKWAMKRFDLEKYIGSKKK